jgi:HAD superfamily phosphatase (TIGR01681 family)
VISTPSPKPGGEEPAEGKGGPSAYPSRVCAGRWPGEVPRGSPGPAHLLSRAIAELNLCLRDALRDAGTAGLIEMNTLRARVGESLFHDPRYWHIGKAPFARAAFQGIASECFRALRAQKGRNRKCLVLDCDNTLWGGVVGEEGLAGIALGRSHPGSAYVEFQHEIVNLKDLGVLIALCSKNNADDVWEVFHNHPDMVLREEHLAAWRLDWNDKVANLDRG